jgi:hypothetical protein
MPACREGRAEICSQLRGRIGGYGRRVLIFPGEPEFLLPGRTESIWKAA